MIKPLPHKREPDRLEALIRYNVLDTPAEQEYDDITLLAAFVTKSPTALLSFVDKERQWFKSKVGFDLEETPRDIAFCAHAIHESDIFIVNDATKDERFFDNPLVTSGKKVKFYAGAPLVTADGLPLGSLCVMDSKPRDLSEEEKTALNALARQVLAQLELRDRNKQLEESLQKIKNMQEQLITQEKLASLGTLTAGIAHEIKNPLNFVNNFSQLSEDLLIELQESFSNLKKIVADEKLIETEEIISTLKFNLKKINEHGARADGIVKNMLMHSRGKSSEKQATDINSLLKEYINLAYLARRAHDKDFNVKIKTNYSEDLPKLNVAPQNLSRVFLNIIDNALYEAFRMKEKLGKDFTPVIDITTINSTDSVEVVIRDNGKGIAEDHRDKIFTPFFTTKPTGKGIGLGLSISYDIITKEHQGELTFTSKENEFTEFRIKLPR